MKIILQIKKNKQTINKLDFPGLIRFCVEMALKLHLDHCELALRW